MPASFFGFANTPGDNGANGNNLVTLTPPASMTAGQLVYVFVTAGAVGSTLSVSEAGGQSWGAGTNLFAESTSSRGFWCEFNGTWTADPSFASSAGSSTAPVTARMLVFTPDAAGDTWAEDVTDVEAGFTAPAAPNDVTIAGITTLTNNAVVIAAWHSKQSPIVWTLQTAGWTSPGGVAQVRNLMGIDSSTAVAYQIKAAAGATGSVTNRQSVAKPGHIRIIAFRDVPPGGPAALAPANVAHLHTLAATTLAQSGGAWQGSELASNTLDYASETGILASAEPAGDYVLATNNLAQAQATGATTASQHHEIASLADLLHPQGLAAAPVIQNHELAPADLAHAQALGVAVFGHHILDPDGAVHGHVLGTPEVIQVLALAPANIAQAHGLDPSDWGVPAYAADMVFLGGLELRIGGNPTLVGGREVRVYEDPSLEIEDRIEERSTASFVVRDDEGSLSFHEHERVVIFDELGARAYAGYIETVQETRINQAGAKRHAIRCVDNHYKADKRRVARSYTNQTVAAIVEDLVTTYLEEEDVILADALIDDGPTIGEVIFNYRPLTEVLDRLADLANAWWRIDHDNILHFRQRATEPASWTLTGTDIVGTPSYSRSNPMYRNRQYIRGPRDLTDPQTYGPRNGDGVTREWAMGFPIAKVPTVKKNTVTKTTDLKMFADTHSADFYWQKGDAVLTQDTNGTVLGTGDTIEVTYQGEFNIIIRAEDTAETVRRQEVEGGGSGIVESVDDDASINSRGAGLEKAAALLKKYSIEGEQLQFTTYRGDLVPGQVQAVDLPAHALDNDELLVTEITTQRVRTATGFAYRRRVTEVLGPSIGSWARFFLKIGRMASVIDRVSVGEEAGLTILQSFSEDVGIAEDVAFAVNACSFPAEDLYPSESLYPC